MLSQVWGMPRRSDWTSAGSHRQSLKATFGTFEDKHFLKALAAARALSSAVKGLPPPKRQAAAAGALHLSHTLGTVPYYVLRLYHTSGAWTSRHGSTRWQWYDPQHVCYVCVTPSHLLRIYLFLYVG